MVELDETSVLDALDAGVAAQVISETPDAVDRYGFSHALIRRTLHDEMSTTRRVRLHHRIAEALEREPMVPPTAAWPNSPITTARQLWPGTAEKAVHYAMAAGARAIELLSYEEAVDHFRSALPGHRHGAR